MCSAGRAAEAAAAGSPGAAAVPTCWPPTLALTRMLASLPPQEHVYQAFEDVLPYEEFSIRLNNEDLPQVGAHSSWAAHGCWPARATA